MAIEACKICRRLAREAPRASHQSAAAAMPRAGVSRETRRGVSSVQHFRGPHGTVKVDMTSKVVGIAQSRGERPYQEDTYSACWLQGIPSRDLRLNLRDSSNREATNWTASNKGQDTDEPVAYLACYDGHGGDQVSKLLVQRLPELVEQAAADAVPGLLESYKGIGGYMRRFSAPLLERHAGEGSNPNMSLDERATLAWLQADDQVVKDDNIGNCGSTATGVFLHSLDEQPAPFFAASRLSLTVAHVGDTKALLASQRSGRVQALTQAHHPDSRVESERLQRTGAGLVTDSFGEGRWGGALANTRAIGDKRFKRLGVVGEPEIIKRVLEGNEWAFLALVSDGITGVMSDQEIVDLCRGHKDPKGAAKAVVSFAEEVGGDDNMTCLIVPLPGWQKLGGSDTTAARREYRLRQSSSASSRSRRQ